MSLVKNDDRGELDLTKQIEIKDQEIQTLKNIVDNLKNIIDMKEAEITAFRGVNNSHKELNGQLRQEIEDTKKKADKLMMNKIIEYENKISELKDYIKTLEEDAKEMLNYP